MDYLNATPVTTTNYIGNFVYNNNIVAYAQSADGRIVFTSPATVYSESYITDHLGNIRATFKCNTSGQTVLLQTFNYYPFGLRVKGSTEVTYPNEYMYQGKELDNENGLNWYNFHARLYDPVLGRWHSPDPAQQYVNPYLAMGNDPVNRVDPNGMKDKWWEKLLAFFGIQRAENGSQLKFLKPHRTWLTNWEDTGTGINGLPDGVFPSMVLGHEGSGGGGGGGSFSLGSQNSNYEVGAMGRGEASTFITTKNAGHVVKYKTNIFGWITSIEGVKIRYSYLLNKGTAFTLPGIAIYANPSLHYNLQLFMHEFGHVLQAYQWGSAYFYEVVGPTSMRNYKKYKGNWTIYDRTWTEWSANKLSYLYFGEPAWDPIKYPLSPGSSHIETFSPDSDGPGDFLINWIYGENHPKGLNKYYSY